MSFGSALLVSGLAATGALDIYICTYMYACWGSGLRARSGQKVLVEVGVRSRLIVLQHLPQLKHSCRRVPSSGALLESKAVQCRAMDR